MKYFIDTEFLEGTQKTFFGKQTKPTIDLISIGIISEDNREYYAISKDFNLKEAWNRFDVKVEQVFGDMRNIYPEGIKRKVYWLRENVLKPIYHDLMFGNSPKRTDEFFTYKNLKKLISKYGKTNKQIAEEIVGFTKITKFVENKYGSFMIENPNEKGGAITGLFEWDKPEFYAYYADYDWVAFCWLFGKMIDLPKGFPMYCKDLKQLLDDRAMMLPKLNREFTDKYIREGSNFEERLKDLKNHPDYPKQTNNHNALADARWNYDLYKFLNTI